MELPGTIPVQEKYWFPAMSVATTADRKQSEDNVQMFPTANFCPNAEPWVTSLALNPSHQHPSSPCLHHSSGWSQVWGSASSLPKPETIVPPQTFWQQWAKDALFRKAADLILMTWSSVKAITIVVNCFNIYLPPLLGRCFYFKVEFIQLQLTDIGSCYVFIYGIKILP